MTEAALRRPPDPHIPREPWWVGLLVPDPETCRTFYRCLFGWEFADGGERAPYTSVLAHGREIAGLGASPAAVRHRPAWLPYLTARDAGTAAARVHECGGTVAVGPLPAGDGGRTALAADPAGAAFGIRQPPPGTGAPEPGAPAHGTPAWHELVTPEPEFVRPFYTHVLDCTAEEEPPGRLTLVRDGRPVAEVSNGDSSDPLPHWRTSFAVDDPDATAHEALRLGGTVLRAPAHAPAGRAAVLADPQGTPFTVLRPGRRSSAEPGDGARPAAARPGRASPLPPPRP